MNIVVIGGTACGPKAAARARRCDPLARITIVEETRDISTATCGLPYYVSGVIDKRAALTARGPDYFLEVMDVNVALSTRATKINREAHTIETTNLRRGQYREIEYDKLVLATGSTPVIPEIEGVRLKGITTLSRIEDAVQLYDAITAQGVRNVAIIGAGLIGMELAEAFTRKGLKVTIIETLDRVLPKLLDFEMASQVEKHLRANGVDVLLGQRVVAFSGNEQGQVKKVITADKEIDAETVVLSVGVRPNTALAKAAGLAIGRTGGIIVDSHLRTSDADIYAGGDCVENKDLVTGQPVLVPMGSTANKHGRVIGTNVTGGNETFPGVLGTAIARVFDCNVARTGLNEQQVREAGYEFVTCLVPGNEHASYYPGGRDILVKLIAKKPEGGILGAQIVGPGDVAKRIDVMATALSFGATAEQVASFDLAYAPPFNSAIDPLHHAANVLRNKLSGLAESLTPMQVKAMLDRNEDLILLDVRTPDEWATGCIASSAVRLVELRELRDRLDEVPKDRDIVIYCKTSARAYQAQRILNGEGYHRVKFMDGSMDFWPYSVTEGKPGASGEIQSCT